MRTSQADTRRNPNNDHLVKHTHFSLLSPAAPVNRLHQRGRDNAAAPSRLICWFNTEKQQIKVLPCQWSPVSGKTDPAVQGKGPAGAWNIFYPVFQVWKARADASTPSGTHLLCPAAAPNQQSARVYYFLTSQTWERSKLSSERWSGPNTELINVICSCRKTQRTKLKVKSCCWHSCFDPTQIFIKGPEVKPSPTDGAVSLSLPQTEPASTSNNRTMDNSGLFGLKDVFFLYSLRF